MPGSTVHPCFDNVMRRPRYLRGPIRLFQVVKVEGVILLFVKENGLLAFLGRTQPLKSPKSQSDLKMTLPPTLGKSTSRCESVCDVLEARSIGLK